MSDSTAPAPPEEGVAKLYLDEATGERVSKSELKKREKARQVAAKKAEKAATAGPAPTKKEPKVSEEEAEKELTPNVCVN